MRLTLALITVLTPTAFSGWFNHRFRIEDLVFSELKTSNGDFHPRFNMPPRFDIANTWRSLPDLCERDVTGACGVVPTETASFTSRSYNTSALAGLSTAIGSSVAGSTVQFVSQSATSASEGMRSAGGSSITGVSITKSTAVTSTSGALPCLRH